MKNFKFGKWTVLSLVVTLAVAAILFFALNYFCLPALGWKLGTLLIGAVSLFFGWLAGFGVAERCYRHDNDHLHFIALILVAILVLGMVISGIMSIKPFHEDDVKARLDMEEVSREEIIEMLPAIDQDGAYSWVDSATAMKLASRKMGELTKLVNIYTASKTAYTAIEDGKLVKYVPLNYAGVFKAAKAGNIPGYIKVDPVKQTAEYVEVEMHYSPSAFFRYDLMRHVRNNFPTDYLGNYSFQVSPEGVPYWVVELQVARGFWSVREVVAVVMVDANSGACTKYALADAPAWVTCIYGDTAQSVYREASDYVNGWWNPSGLGETTTTNDWGYVAINGELYYTTGVTSTVTDGGDESNLGMLLYNAHTNKAYYCEIPGAEEYSAMEEVEGIVQNFGYKAAFPSLTNVGGHMTYVMVLKSDNGVVKQYGMVNYENYTIAVTADTMDACRVAYAKALANAGDKDVETMTMKTLIVDAIEYIVQGGETTVYIRDMAGNVYKAAFEEGFLFVKTNDSIEVGILDETSDIKVVTLSKLVPIESVQTESETENIE